MRVCQNKTRLRKIKKENLLARENFWTSWMRDVKQDIMYPALVEWQLFRYHSRQIESPERMALIFQIREIVRKVQQEDNDKWNNACYRWDMNNGYENTTLRPKKIRWFSYLHLIEKLKELIEAFHSGEWTFLNPPYQRFLIQEYIDKFKELSKIPPMQTLDNFMR